jgi:16S rRNA (guanine(966)-N(2))-methyltransferase RsmD
VRIIAGAYKGRRLVTPRGDVTRPTADQVRIALMDTLMPWLPNVRLLDLFAGAGGVGLEALSRGAAHVTFVERDARAVTALRDNVATLGVADAARVVRDDVLRALAALRRAGERFGVVFLDPPYEAELTTATLGALGDGALLAAGALVVAQHLTKRGPAEIAGVLRAFRTRRFGETTLTFFRADGYDAPSTPTSPRG